MKKLAKYIYIIKTILFIVNFYFVFIMLHSILDTEIYGRIFIIVYLIFTSKILYEILSKKIKYQNDVVYNGMQIGLMIYLMIISIKITYSKVYVTRVTLNYFKTNYIILSILICFILFYSILDNSSKKNVKQP